MPRDKAEMVIGKNPYQMTAQEVPLNRWDIQEEGAICIVCVCMIEVSSTQIGTKHCKM